MTTRASDCPSPETLAKHHAQALPAAEAQLVAQHIAACPSCRSQASATTMPSHVAAQATTMLQPPQGPDELGRLGGYIIRRIVGEGSMGVVFEAEDETLHRLTAVKVLKPALNTESFRKRFLQEARIAAALPHDHIITIYQAGEDNGVLYLAMELLHGESLETRLARDRWLPLGQALDIARQVAEGLAVAHARKLVHRDIKPDNIWLTTDGPRGPFRRVKILDFGLARPIQSDAKLTAQGVLLGAPGYMAPERIRGLPVDERSDLFSLGCVLYRMLAGAGPFERKGDHAGQVIEAVLHSEPEPLEQRIPQVPKQVAQLVTELLAKDPAQRPVNASSVAKRLKVLEYGQVATAAAAAEPARETTTNRMLDWGRRHPWGLWSGLAMIVAAMLVVGGVGYLKLSRILLKPDTTEERAGEKGKAGD